MNQSFQPHKRTGSEMPSLSKPMQSSMQQGHPVNQAFQTAHQTSQPMDRPMKATMQHQPATQMKQQPSNAYSQPTARQGISRPMQSFGNSGVSQFQANSQSVKNSSFSAASDSAWKKPVPSQANRASMLSGSSMQPAQAQSFSSSQRGFNTPKNSGWQQPGMRTSVDNSHRFS